MPKSNHSPDHSGHSQDSNDTSNETSPLLSPPKQPQSYYASTLQNAFSKRAGRHKSRAGKGAQTHSPKADLRIDVSGSGSKSCLSDEPASSSVLDHSPTHTDNTLWASLNDNTKARQRPLSALSNVHLVLENTGSVARDHLASERTFLAYLRTSLAIASSGVALVQLFTMASSVPNHPGGVDIIRPYIRPLGTVTIMMGLIVLFLGVSRYFTIQSALTKGQFPVARYSLGVIAFVMTIIVTLTFGILVAGQSTKR